MNTQFSMLLRRNPHAQPGSENCRSKPAITVTTSGDLSVRSVGDGRCVLVGDCFPKVPQSSCEGDDATQLVRSLADAFWGRFIITAQDPVTNTIAIYRDPSGMVPCYYALDERSVTIGSDAIEIQARTHKRRCIDWEGVANCLVAPNLRNHQTCLKGIYEVIPGEMVLIESDEPRHDLIWDPGAFAGQSRRYTFDEAVQSLEDTLTDTLKHWCRRYANPLVSVSGGFDSSAIAALASQIVPIEIVHFYTAYPQGDERPYATALARHLGRNIHTVFCQPDAVTVRRNLSCARPRPSARAFTQIFDKASDDYAAKVGAAAHFSGGGGDNVFGKLHSAYPVTDRYRSEGLRGGLAETIFDVCHVTGASMPDVLRQAIRGWMRPAIADRWSVHPDFLTPQAMATLHHVPHMWLSRCSDMMPGERQLIRNIARATALTDHLNIQGDLPTIYPFLSQPVVERCLEMPTWYWFSGGRDRALARAALRTALPAQLLDRRGKGAFDGLLNQVLLDNWDDIFNDLKDGLLVQQGILEPLEIAKAQEGDIRANTTFSILYIHETEMWCRAWS